MVFFFTGLFGVRTLGWISLNVDVEVSEACDIFWPCFSAYCAGCWLLNDYSVVLPSFFLSIFFWNLTKNNCRLLSCYFLLLFFFSFNLSDKWSTRDSKTRLRHDPNRSYFLSTLISNSLKTPTRLTQLVLALSLVSLPMLLCNRMKPLPMNSPWRGGSTFLQALPWCQELKWAPPHP